jgi:hypothetical protein
MLKLLIDILSNPRIMPTAWTVSRTGNDLPYAKDEYLANWELMTCTFGTKNNDQTDEVVMKSPIICHSTSLKT